MGNDKIKSEKTKKKSIRNVEFYTNKLILYEEPFNINKHGRKIKRNASKKLIERKLRKGFKNLVNLFTVPYIPKIIVTKK